MPSPHPDLCTKWTHHLSAVSIPVLRSTRDALAAWREQPDRADANSLADTILRDPLMTLRLLIYVSARLGSRLATPVETVTAGLVLVGIEPFLRDFGALAVLEDVLTGEPQALAHVLDEIERSHRAARLAAAFAIHRLDEDAEVLHQAALLENFAGLLVWCETPGLALEIAARQRANPALRSTEAQRAVLGTDLAAMELELMTAWGLPEFLREMIGDAGKVGKAGPRCVALAVRIARHSQVSWSNPALPDDFAELGRLLNMPTAAAAALVKQVEH